MTASNVISGIGISRVAQNFLSLSSILRPLAPTLANTAMSAGFAGFQFGGLPAILTLVSASVAALRDIFMGLAKTALDAGLATKGFMRSFTFMKSEMGALQIDLGLTVQEAFAPAIEAIGKAFRDFDTTALKDFIGSLGALSEQLVILGSGPAADTAILGIKMINFEMRMRAQLLKAYSERLVEGKGLFESIESARTMFDDVDSTGLTRVNTRGSITGVGDLGGKIQSSLLNTDYKQRQEMIAYLKGIERNTDSKKTPQAGLN